MADITQYIGSRYVPVFADPAEWNSTRTYEPLTIVLNKGNSYTSRQFVPVGVELTNTDYWLETGNYNAQVEAYRKEVSIINEKINERSKTYDTYQDAITANLPIGTVFYTLGYYNINDGGAGAYTVTNESNDYTIPYGSNYALLSTEEVSPKQFGAIGNGISDDTNYIEITKNYIKANNSTALIVNGMFGISRRITFTKNVGQLSVTGKQINRCGFKCLAPDSGITFGIDDSIFYELDINNIEFNGNYMSNPLKLNNVSNIYLSRIHILSPNNNNYCLILNNCIIISIDGCIIEGGSNTSAIPQGNGVLCNRVGSILNVTNCNIWNLNKVFEFTGYVLNGNFNNNWVECIFNFITYTNEADNRYTKFRITDNTFSVHNENGIIYNNNFSFFNINTSDDTIWYLNKFIVQYNVFYIANHDSLPNNSLIYANNIKSGYSAILVFEYNSFTSKSLSALNAYAWFTNDSGLWVMSYITDIVADSDAATNNKVNINEHKVRQYDLVYHGRKFGETYDNEGRIVYDKDNNNFGVFDDKNQYHLMPRAINDTFIPYDYTSLSTPEAVAKAINSLARQLTRCYLMKWGG